jgi:hypothetical protein
VIRGEKEGKLPFKAKAGLENKKCKQYLKSEYPKSQTKTKGAMIPIATVMFNLWGLPQSAL